MHFFHKEDGSFSKYERIGELNEYLPSMKFDSYYDDNLLQPEVSERAAQHSYFIIQRPLPQLGLTLFNDSILKCT